jgi:chromosome partitioning protein
MVRRGNIFDSCLQTLQSGAQIPILKSTIAMRNGSPSRSSMAAWSVRKSAASTERTLWSMKFQFVGNQSFRNKNEY